MRDQIAAVKKHIDFIEEPVITVKNDPKSSQDVQREPPFATQEGHVYQSAVELIPMQRAIEGLYEYQFAKPADVPGLSHDGWEVWTPQATSDETSRDSSGDSSDDSSNDKHDMMADSCSCQPAPYRIRYGDVAYLRPERVLHGWGDWDVYHPGQIVEAHEDSRDWHAPIKGPFATTLGNGSALDLFKVVNEQSRGCLTLKEAVDLYREHVVREDFEEFEECHFCAGNRAGSGKVLFKV